MQQEQQLDAAGIPLLSPVLLPAGLSAASVTLWRKTKELSVLAKLQLVAGHSHRRPVMQDTPLQWRHHASSEDQLIHPAQGGQPPPVPACSGQLLRQSGEGCH